MKRWRCFAASFTLLAFAMACGGSTGDSDGGSASCTTAPCGGELVGTWTAKQGCASGSYTSTIAGCTSTTVTVSNFTVGGTLTFNGDGTWNDSLNESLSAHEEFPATCLAAAECTQHEASLTSQPGITGASCQFGDACACDYVSTVTLNKSGSFQTSGSSVTFAGAGQPDTEGYCVSGNTLTLRFGMKGLSASVLFERL
jgi:hypothetical protein